MPHWNAIDYPIESIRTWIAEGKTQQWIATELGMTGKTGPKLIYKVCKKHKIKCQRTGPRAGVGHPGWKGGLLTDKSGYFLVYCPGHPYGKKGYGGKRKYVREHRLVMEGHLQRYLLPLEIVHHKNGNPKDNRLENLELFSRNSDHLRASLSGKCPKWTPQGIEMIKKGLKKRHGIQSKLKSDAFLNK